MLIDEIQTHANSIRGLQEVLSPITNLTSSSGRLRRGFLFLTQLALPNLLESLKRAG